MKKLMIAAALAVSALAAQAAEGVQTIRAEVNGMVCAFCAQGIEMKMNKQAATRAVFVDLKNKVVAVELKPGQTMALDKFKADIKDAGYDVVKAEFVPQTVAAIKAQYAKK
ncbi:MAG TPA: heavy-metal-associated domain-containing protein [Burkholderiaceae bacterium]|nr:heavy-metal-associated domain-containing protein [Burkholderiaceae bacterium]